MFYPYFALFVLVFFSFYLLDISMLLVRLQKAFSIFELSADIVIPVFNLKRPRTKQNEKTDKTENADIDESITFLIALA